MRQGWLGDFVEPQEPIDVTIQSSVKAARDWKQITVSGNTNLPTGTRLRIRVAPSVATVQSDDMMQDSTQVERRGTFAVELPSPGRVKTGDYRVSISLLEDQPSAIRKRIGQNHAFLVGHHVVRRELRHNVSQISLRPTSDQDQLVQQVHNLNRYGELLKDHRDELSGLVRRFPPQATINRYPPLALWDKEFEAMKLQTETNIATQKGLVELRKPIRALEQLRLSINPLFQLPRSVRMRNMSAARRKSLADQIQLADQNFQQRLEGLAEFLRSVK